MDMEPHERDRVALLELQFRGWLLAEYPMMVPQTVPGRSLVVSREELSRMMAAHLDDDDDDWAGHGSILARVIKRWWPDTFQLEDCSVLLQALGPVTLSWRNLRQFLRPLPQNDCTCALKACTMAIEGMHRMLCHSHGPNTFRAGWMPAPGWNDQLLSKCRKKGIWTEGKGAAVKKVLTVIQELGGVTTASDQGGQMGVMPLDGFEEYIGDGLTAELVAMLLDQGPCIGRLFACPWYSYFDATKNDDWVYRGCGRDRATRKACKKRYPKQKDNMGSHAVVCFAYRKFQNGEMHVRVLDNHTEDGPERWVHVKELDALYNLTVYCLKCGYAHA